VRDEPGRRPENGEGVDAEGTSSVRRVSSRTPKPTSPKHGSAHSATFTSKHSKLGEPLDLLIVTGCDAQR
jgi:hypothetical protein